MWEMRKGLQELILKLDNGVLANGKKSFLDAGGPASRISLDTNEAEGKTEQRARRKGSWKHTCFLFADGSFPLPVSCVHSFWRNLEFESTPSPCSSTYQMVV